MTFSESETTKKLHQGRENIISDRSAADGPMFSGLLFSVTSYEMLGKIDS